MLINERDESASVLILGVICTPADNNMQGTSSLCAPGYEDKSALASNSLELGHQVLFFNTRTLLRSSSGVVGEEGREGEIVLGVTGNSVGG